MGRQPLKPRENYQNFDILEGPEMLNRFRASSSTCGDRNHFIFVQWTQGLSISQLMNRFGLTQRSIQAVLETGRDIYEAIAKGETDEWGDIRMMLLANYGDAVVSRTIRSMINWYGTERSPKDILALATSEELRQIPGVRAMADALMDIQPQIRAKYPKTKVMEILLLKQLLYFVYGDERERSVELLTWKLVENGITNTPDLVFKGAMLIAQRGKYFSEKERRLLENAFRLLVQTWYPDMKEPMTLILWDDEDQIRVMPGVDAERLQRIVKDLTSKGNQVGIGGRMPTTNIRVIKISKKGKNEHE